MDNPAVGYRVLPRMLRTHGFREGSPREALQSVPGALAPSPRGSLPYPVPARTAREPSTDMGLKVRARRTPRGRHRTGGLGEGLQEGRGLVLWFPRLTAVPPGARLPTYVCQFPVYLAPIWAVWRGFRADPIGPRSPAPGRPAGRPRPPHPFGPSGSILGQRGQFHGGSGAGRGATPQTTARGSATEDHRAAGSVGNGRGMPTLPELTRIRCAQCHEQPGLDGLHMPTMVSKPWP